MKIDVKLLKRTQLGFPSRWEHNELKLEFRYGRLKIYLDNKLMHELNRHWIEIDLDGYMSDQDLIRVLKKNNLND